MWKNLYSINVLHLLIDKNVSDMFVCVVGTVTVTVNCQTQLPAV